MTKHKNPYFRNKSYTIMIKVDDEWYPNFPNNEIKLSVYLLPQLKRDGDLVVVRICAWGADDYGLEIDYYVSSNKEQTSKYRGLVGYADELKELEPINADYLKSEGFGPA